MNVRYLCALHCLRLRLEVMLAVLGCAFFGSVALYAGWDVWTAIKRQEGWLVVWPLFLMLGILAGALFMLWGARSMWFFLYRYRLTDGTLDVFDPILRKRWSVALKDVTQVRTFYLLHGSRDRRAKIAHSIETADGVRVRVSEALPIWPEIADLIAHVEMEELRLPWWARRR